MIELTDHELLEQFARHGSEEAFATLVARHLRLVYSAAFRSTNNSHHAEEIAQVVFIMLARKAGRLSPRVVLSGWLYQTAQLTAANFIKGEMRRQRREQVAVMESTLNESNSPDWGKISPLLEQAIGRLGETDRDAIVLRYFEGRSIAEIGLALRVNETTARKRVTRAVEKLRQFFGRRGLVLTSEAIAETISTNWMQVVPDGLASTIAGLAMAKGASAGASTLTLVKETGRVILWAKTKMALLATVGLLLATGAAVVTVEEIRDSSADKYFPLIEQGLLKDGLIERGPLSNAPPYFILRPTHYATNLSRGFADDVWAIGRNEDLQDVISSAYRMFPAYRLVFPNHMQTNRFDYLVYEPKGGLERFQAQVRKRFGYTGHKEMRNEDVLLMRVKNTNAAWLTPSRPGYRATNSGQKEPLFLNFQNYPFSALVMVTEDWLGKPVIDETGYSGNYDVKLASFGDKADLRKAILEKWGLELVATNEPIEKLVVEKIKK